MPLPTAAERAAGSAAGIGRDLDAMLVAHIVNGTRLPTVAQFRARIEDAVAAAVVAAMLDMDPDAPQQVLDAAVLDALNEAALLYQRARRDAMGRRQRITRRKTDPVPDDERVNLVTLPRLAASFGFAAAVGALLKRSKGRRVPRRRLQQAAARSGVALPPRLEATLRASVRTKAAELRNHHAADMLDAKPEGWALYIRDALKGDDEPCVRVDRRWATAVWLRRHPVEHPNCTREGRPRKLPKGARITLHS